MSASAAYIQHTDFYEENLLFLQKSSVVHKFFNNSSATVCKISYYLLRNVIISCFSGANTNFVSLEMVLLISTNDQCSTQQTPTQTSLKYKHMQSLHTKSLVYFSFSKIPNSLQILWVDARNDWPEGQSLVAMSYRS